MIVIENKFDIGDVVYLRTDKDQDPAIILSIQIFKEGEPLYEVIRNTTTSRHYDFELSHQRDQLLTCT